MPHRIGHSAEERKNRARDQPAACPTFTAAALLVVQRLDPAARKLLVAHAQPAGALADQIVHLLIGQGREVVHGSLAV
jgi:hypothetical protein